MLWEHGVDCPTNCVICDHKVKNIVHILFSCANNQHVWQKIYFFLVIADIVVHQLEVSDMIFKVLQ